MLLPRGVLSTRGALGLLMVVTAGLVALGSERAASASGPDLRAQPVTLQAGPTVIAQAPPQPTDGGAARANARQLFDRFCGRCHPGGDEDIGPRIRGVNWEEARMRTQVRNGVGRMRPIPATRLSDADFTTMMEFLRQINAVRPAAGGH